MRHILFTCQNRQEVDALLPVADELEGRPASSIQCRFLSQDFMFQQGVTEELRSRGRDPIGGEDLQNLETRYDDLSPVRKVQVIEQATRSLSGVMEDFDALVSGIDGLPVRYLVQQAGRQEKPWFQLLPSLFLEDGYPGTEPLSLQGVGKRLLAVHPRFRFLSRPDQPCRSGDGRIYVMGERVRDSLQPSGVDGDRIRVTGIPRFAELFEVEEGDDEDSAEIWEPPIDVLYIPGSWHGHGKHAIHEAQQAQLEALATFVESHDAYRLVIKEHPREARRFYDWLRGREPEVEFLPPGSDPREAIRRCQVVVTIGSTLAYEAALLDTPVIVPEFPGRVTEETHLHRRDFEPAASVDELSAILDWLRQDASVRTATVRDQREAVTRTISPRSPDASTMIATEIAETINCR
jgi:hypothetical protein